MLAGNTETGITVTYDDTDGTIDFVVATQSDNNLTNALLAILNGLSSSAGVLSNGVTATTQSASDNSTKVATTAYTDTAISNLVDSSPSALNTLNELAAALGDDANFSTTVTNSIATKLALAGGTLTGNLTLSSSYIDFSGSISTPSTAAAIYRPADNQLAISTANNQRLLISNNGLKVVGSIGVNTSVGSADIHIGAQGGDDNNSLRIDGTNNTSGGQVHRFVVKNQGDSALIKIQTSAANATETDKIVIESITGHIRAGSDSAQDLGSSSVRWRNVYADTLYGDGSNLTGISASSPLVNDTTPQLGGDLDTNSFEISLDLSLIHI